MIRFLHLVSFIVNWGYVLLFLRILHTFLPLRRNHLLRILALLSCNYLASVIIYSNDVVNLLGALLGFALFLTVFHSGQWREKLTTLLVFYPPLIAVNYLMISVGKHIFFHVTGAPPSSDNWTPDMFIINTVLFSLFLLLRLLFWVAAWRFLKKYLNQITTHLTTGMWTVVDVLMLSPFVAIFTIICFMPENAFIAWPICTASIFSGFGCIYLASYICNSIQTAYHARELEEKQAWYRDRMDAEERVRSIYHDLKNHLLLMSQTESRTEVQSSIAALQDQIQEYENYYHTGNDFLDIILRDKARTAQKKQIDFHAEIFLESSTFIDPLDISTLFGNALDNAIEASEKLPPDQRLITVKARRIRDMLVIIVENNAAAAPPSPEKTTKDDSFLHGFGISNIRKSADRYGGECSIRTEDGVFTLKIMIPVP